MIRKSECLGLNNFFIIDLNTTKNYIVYRLPKDDEIKKQWIAAIGGVLHGSGSICNLHFCDSDIKVLKNEIRLKKCAVPSQNLSQPEIQIDNSENISDFNATQSTDAANQLDACDSCIDLKKSLIKLQLDCDVKMEAKDKKIELFTNKCSDQSHLISSLLQKIGYLELNEKRITSENEKLRTKLLSSMNASTIEVKCSLSSYPFKIVCYMFKFFYRVVDRKKS